MKPKDADGLLLRRLYGRARLRGAHGRFRFITVVYAITKINYTYEIPLFLILTLRGAVGDHHAGGGVMGCVLLLILDGDGLCHLGVVSEVEMPLIGDVGGGGIVLQWQ